MTSQNMISPISGKSRRRDEQEFLKGGTKQDGFFIRTTSQPNTATIHAICDYSREKFASDQ
jgi:hypothetical protein